MDLYLDPITNDLEMINGDLPFTTDFDTFDNPESIRQFMISKLQTFYGECFLNGNKGITYFDDIFVKNPNMILIDAIFKKEILDIPGVIGLTNFSLSIDTTIRKLYLTFTAKTLNGIIDFSGSIP